MGERRIRERRAFPQWRNEARNIDPQRRTAHAGVNGRRKAQPATRTTQNLECFGGHEAEDEGQPGQLSAAGQTALRLLKGAHPDSISIRSGGQEIDFRRAPGLREVGGYIKRLEQARAICTGAFENGLLDNTEGACAGWWRGCDYGYEKGQAEIKQLREHPFLAIPPDLDFRNACTEPCDAINGPCACKSQHDVEWLWERVRGLRAEIQRLREESPSDLRSKGWTVGVHNDYRQNAEPYTFWLLTHRDGRYVKGEGQSDGEALNEIREALEAQS